MLLLLRFYVFTFFWKSKNVTFYVFCLALHVFLNYGVYTIFRLNSDLAGNISILAPPVNSIVLITTI